MIKYKNILFVFFTGLAFLLIMAGLLIFQTLNRTKIQIDICQNLDIIALSTYAEPPQFAIWIENIRTHELKTVFVTHRASTGDWEGKTHVPVALPRWYDLFMEENTPFTIIEDEKFMAVTGATPKKDYFSIRIEVKPGTKWFCWIEVNLAGDYNEAFPELNLQTFEEDEFATGQPALLYKAEIIAAEGMIYTPDIVAQSKWLDGENKIEPVGDGITTAKNIFDSIQISVIRPKPKLIDKVKIKVYKNEKDY
ncbi:hypothetical protein D1164_00800 [Mariniphaga sediminis]|uniref:Uncharacterized protein n=1 Tax=Mariniphaga sediminis TaxID=1628158 RepID=A0A399D534_9BACT|nr:hypothetical protein [Mariniphaga sediminis]RIH67004.1 hypothetical protein D1164_00800 [Mariniphaga sediminis]